MSLPVTSEVLECCNAALQITHERVADHETCPDVCFSIFFAINIY